MRVSEHEEVKRQNDGLLRDIKAEREKFKTAITDLAAARFEIEEYRPDALAMRRKRQRDRDLKAAKAAKKVQP
jgi:hypothetical protein